MKPAMCLFVTWIAIQAFAQSATSGVPHIDSATHQASVAEAFSPGSVVPTFDNGYVISRASMGGPQIALYDRDGRRSQLVNVNFSDARKVHIGAVGVSARGELIVAGATTDADNEASYYIAKADPVSGSISSIVRVESFAPCKFVRTETEISGHLAQSFNPNHKRLMSCVYIQWIADWSDRCCRATRSGRHSSETIIGTVLFCGAPARWSAYIPDRSGSP
ncbi:MAG: hypothetical protein JWO13_3143 [Acidobacteriales bacterium]|nr:hypothetical protein [Terriglobales bacterium]